MDSRVLLVLCTLGAAGALALRIGSRPRRSDLDSLLLGLLAAIGVWTTGVGAWISLPESALRHVALHMAFLGVFAAMPLWLIFALRAARPTCHERWPALPALIAAPGALEYLALLTNSVHHGMLRDGVPLNEFREFAGPMLLAFAVLSIVMLGLTTAVLWAWAWRLRRRPEVHRASLVALVVAGILPVAAGLSRLLLASSTVHAVFSASFVLALLLLAAGPLRDRMLREVPLSHRDVFDSLRDGVLVANAQGEIVDVNAAAERMLGRTRALLCGRALSDAIAELAAPERDAPLRRELEDLASTSAPLRLDVALRDGRRLEVRAACVGDSDAEVLGRYALLRDRTEEQRFSEAARRAQKLETVATLAGGVAHEVSNPLAFVRANLTEIDRLGAVAERVLAAGPSPLASELADLRGLAREALEGITRIERIAAGMRRLSTASEGFGVVELEPVVNEAVQLARIRFARPLDVDLRLDPALPCVRGAPALLVQALLHLIVAAQRGAPASGAPIEVRGECAGEQVVVRIARAGASERQPGFASEEGGGAAPGGDDPGLPIARDIARDHGGEIEIGGPPAGPTTLALRLPLAEGRPA